MAARRIAHLLLMSSFAVVIGCGDGGAELKPGAATTHSTPPPAQAGDSARGRPVTAGTDSAEGAVRAVLLGLAANRPRVLWEFLPPGYRADLNGVVHHLARTADKELWKRTVAVLTNLVAVLKKQRQLIAEATGATRPVDGDPALAWLQLAGVLDLILQSELADQDRVARLDVGEFLAGTGEKAMRGIESLSPPGAVNPFRAKLSEFSRINVSEIKTVEDRAVVRIEVPGQPAEEVEFVRTEGQWIPRDLADGWIDNMGRANAMVALLSTENLGSSRDELLKLLADVDTALDRLGVAHDRDEFLAALQSAIDTVQRSTRVISGPVEAQHRPAATGAMSVQIVVSGRMDAADRTQLLDRLARAAFEQPSGGTAEYTADETTTIFRISPVTDLEAFVQSLDFLSVTNVDVSARRVRAQLMK